MIKLRNVPCRVSTGIYVSMIIRDVHDIQQNERANISYRCNRLKCHRLDCPPTCLFPIRIIPTPYKFIPWPLWPMLNHWRPDNLARGHLSLLHRYECHLIGLLGLVPGQNAPCIRKTIQILFCQRYDPCYSFEGGTGNTRAYFTGETTKIQTI